MTLLEFCKTPRSRKKIADFLGIGTVFYAMRHYVQPLLAEGKLRTTCQKNPGAGIRGIRAPGGKRRKKKNIPHDPRKRENRPR